MVQKLSKREVFGPEWSRNDGKGVCTQLGSLALNGLERMGKGKSLALNCLEMMGKGKGLHSAGEVPPCWKGGDGLGSLHPFPYLIWDITAALGSGGFLEPPHLTRHGSPPGAGEGSPPPAAHPSGLDTTPHPWEANESPGISATTQRSARECCSQPPASGCGDVAAVGRRGLAWKTSSWCFPAANIPELQSSLRNG